jgi:hypothetical protein
MARSSALMMSVAMAARTMRSMEQTTSFASQPLITNAWAVQPAGDAYQQMFGHEARDWSLLRLVLAASLTVMALGVVVAMYP